MQTSSKKNDSHNSGKAITEPRWLRCLLIGSAVAFITLFLVVPLLAVFYQAFEGGWRAYIASITDENARSAIFLTLIIAAIVVPLNTLFGLAAAWAICKFEFRGKNLLITLIDLPYSISPVISGMMLILLFGTRESWFGPTLNAYHIQLVFNTMGIVLATLFVTFPFVARELIPLMQAQGSEEEEAARAMGASGMQIFWRVTLPNIKWGLLYGVILCNARAMGEFGAVSVVARNIPGEQTMPLYIWDLFEVKSATSEAFAVASLLAVLAVITMILKSLLEWKSVDIKAIESQAYIGD